MWVCNFVPKSIQSLELFLFVLFYTSRNCTWILFSRLAEISYLKKRKDQVVLFLVLSVLQSSYERNWFFFNRFNKSWWVSGLRMDPLKCLSNKILCVVYFFQKYNSGFKSHANVQSKSCYYILWSLSKPFMAIKH